ncbi:Flp family type IVb pilin [Nocardioides ungokensis]
MFNGFERVPPVVRRGLGRRGEAGGTAVEYALMAAFITAVIATSVFAFGIQVRAMFQMGLAMFP